MLRLGGLLFKNNKHILHIFNINKEMNSQVWCFCLRSMSSIQQWLQCFNNNAHIWPEISFILHTQGCNCRHLSLPDYHKNINYSVRHLTWTAIHGFKGKMVIQTVHSVNKRNITHLGNCLWRVFSIQSSVNTLFHLIFTKFWCCLITLFSHSKTNLDFFFFFLKKKKRNRIMKRTQVTRLC